MIPYHKILSLTLLFLLPFTTAINRIKNCKFSSICEEVNKEITVEVNFNILPKTVSQGKLISNSNSSTFFISEPFITKDKKSVVYKFKPNLPEKYHLKFNHDLKCWEVATIYKPFKLSHLPQTMFISDEKKVQPFSFNISFQFTEQISFSPTDTLGNSDINQIEMIENVNSTQIDENSYEKINTCQLDEYDESIIHCKIDKPNGFNFKNNIETLAFYYHTRCRQRETLGFITVLTKKTPANIDKDGIELSLLGKLFGYMLKVFQKDKSLLAVVMVSLEKKSSREFLRQQVAPIANLYPQYVIKYAEWEKDSFITEHFGLKDQGFPMVFIYDFYNDNLYYSNLVEDGQFKDTIESLYEEKLNWTSQKIFQKLLSIFKVKLSHKNENIAYYVFCVFAFGVLIALRIYLYNRKKKKDSKGNANFSFNDKKKKE